MKIAYLPYGTEKWYEYDNVGLWSRSGLGDSLFAKEVNGSWVSILPGVVPYVQDLVRRKDLGILVNGVFGETIIHKRQLQILEATEDEKKEILFKLREYMSFRKRMRRNPPIDMGYGTIDTSKERT